MRGKIVIASLILSLSGAVASAQSKSVVPTPGDIYCSGVVTTQAVPRDTYIITGEESNSKITFDNGDTVFINKGTDQGVKAGDEFFAVREVADPYVIDWTRWQSAILKKMGKVWADEARLKVVVARKNVSIAQVEHECDLVQRGDIVLPFEPRQVPTLKPEDNFDRFAPADGKALAMLIATKNFQSVIGREDIAYVNLGSGQGVKVGDYFRFFRYQGTQHETVYQEPRFAFDQEFDMGVKDVNIVGFGSVPKKWNWTNVPREDIGEGVVLRVGPNASTVLITFSLRELYAGDYVELE